MKIRIAPEYGCFPIWRYDSMGKTNVDVDTLPIELKEHLANWDHEFQRTYNSEDPAASGFHSAVEENAWDSEGVRLFKLFRAALDSSCELEYYRFVPTWELGET